MTALAPPRGVSREAFEEALRVCERTAGADRSNLYVVSQYFRDPRRYQAFITMYSVMRVIDDRVDAIQDVMTLGAADRASHVAELRRWRRRIEAAYEGRVAAGGAETMDVALAAALEAFPVPRVIWSNFLDAMAFDVEHDRFATPGEFLRYAEGGAASPTTVFVYLLCSQPEGPDEGMRREPAAGGSARSGCATDSSRAIFTVRDLGDGFDTLACGRSLGIFAYIAHILRDVAEDLRIGRRGRVYIPLSDLAGARLTEEDFRVMVATGRDDARWRDLVSRLVRRARHHERSGVRSAQARFPAMEPDCRFILSLIIRMYQRLLDEIEASPGSVLTGLPAVRPEERLALVSEAAAEAGFIETLE